MPTSCANDGSTGNPGNPGGGTDPVEPGEGGTTPENPGGTPSIFDESFSYQSGYWTYNGDGTISDMHGNSFTGTLENDEMIFTNFEGNLMRIDKNGNLTEESKAWGQTSQYDVKKTYNKDSTYNNYVEYTGQIQSNNTTINGIDYSGSFPSYIDSFDFNSTGFKAYQDFYNATDLLKQRINATPSGNSWQEDNNALNNYNTSKQNYINFLNQEKNNGTQLSAIDELLLNKSL